MNFERRGPSGDSGKLYEARFLGQAEVDSEFVEAMRALPTDPRGRIPREAAFRTLKEHYAGDPTNPKGVHAKELRGAMLDALQLDEGDFDKLKLYSAVGTPIDVLFGVDAFLELEDPKTRQTVRATIGVTLRKDKEREGGKANFIIGELPDAAQEEDAYLQAIDDHAGAIAQFLQKELQTRQQRRA